MSMLVRVKVAMLQLLFRKDKQSELLSVMHRLFATNSFELTFSVFC